jgi:hypothetical protein
VKIRHVIALLLVVLGLGIGIGLFLRSASPTVATRGTTSAPGNAIPVPLPPRSPAAFPSPAPRRIGRLPPGELAKLQNAIPLMSGLDPARELADARNFEELDAEQRKELEREIATFRSATDVDQKVEILDRIESQHYGAGVLPLVLDLMRSGQPPELRAKAVEVVSGNMSPAILPVLTAALEDPDPLIQARAVLAANHVHGPELLDFLRRVFSHPNANTRLAGLEGLDELPSETRIAALKLALESGREELQLGAVEKLTSQSCHQSVEALIPLLAAPNERVQGQAGAALRFLVGEEFAGAPEAMDWWRTNRNRFDKELNEK